MIRALARAAAAAALTLLLTAPPALAADVKPIVNDAAKLRPVHAGETVGVANGGTSSTSLTAHCVLVGAGTGAPQAVCPTTSGYVLTDNGAGADPSFQASTGLSAIANNNLLANTSGSSAVPIATPFASITGVGSALKWTTARTLTLGTDLSGSASFDGSAGFTLNATIPNNTVTYAKIQDVSATSRVLGRKTAGAGDPEELTLSELLDFIGSAAQGDVLYRGASSWARLGAGTSGQVLQTNGAASNPSWVTPSAGGSGFGDFQKVGGVTASGSPASMTVSGIPAGHAHLVAIINGRGTTVATSAEVHIQFNGDTGANYDWETFHNFGAGGTSFTQQPTQTYGLAGIIAAASATAHRVGAIQVVVPGYAGTTFDKQAATLFGATLGTSAFNVGSGAYGFDWRPATPAAITSFTAFPSAGAWVDGSTLDVYVIN